MSTIWVIFILAALLLCRRPASSWPPGPATTPTMAWSDRYATGKPRKCDSLVYRPLLAQADGRPSSIHMSAKCVSLCWILHVAWHTDFTYKAVGEGSEWLYSLYASLDASLSSTSGHSRLITTIRFSTHYATHHTLTQSQINMIPWTWSTYKGISTELITEHSRFTLEKSIKGGIWIFVTFSFSVSRKVSTNYQSCFLRGWISLH